MDQENQKKNSNAQASQEMQNYINARKKHNDKAFKIRQLYKKEEYTTTHIIKYINHYFYDHDEPITRIKTIEDINVKYIKNILKYICRDNLYFEKYKYKIRSDDPEDIKDLKEILIKKNINIINKSKFDIYDLKKTMKYLNDIFIIDYELNKNIKETILKMLFIYLDDDKDRYFNIDLETGEDDDENEFEQDLFLLLVDYIHPDENENKNKNKNININVNINININNNNNIRLSKNLYLAHFKPSLYDPEYKYNIDQYTNKYFIIFEIINKVSKNIYDIYVYKINYFLNRSFGVVSSNKYLYNFDLDNIERQRINNFYINKYNKMSKNDYDNFTDKKYFSYDYNFDSLEFLDCSINNDPIQYFKYFMTDENKNCYEIIYNLCITYRNNIKYLSNIINTSDILDNTEQLKRISDRLTGNYNTIEILKGENLIECRIFDTLDNWALLNNHTNIINYIDRIIFIINNYDYIYYNEFIEYKNKICNLLL